MTNLTQTPAWQALAAHNKAFPARWAPHATPHHVDAAGLTFDFARHPVTAETWQLLHNLTVQEDVTGWRDTLFSSAVVNASENRAAEHWALRTPQLRADLAEVEKRLWDCAAHIRAGGFKTIINIGIGGSDLGLRLVLDALEAFTDPALDYRFITNIDPVDLERAVRGINPAATLFIIASKSFGTLETMENTQRAKAWLQQHGITDIAKHFVAVTSNVKAATAFGLDAGNCFGFPDTIGGRYSLWGPVGLILRLALGQKNFTEFLGGAYAMDTHFRTAPAAANAPIMAALLSIWHTNFRNATAHAVLPYATRLALLPNFLQQLVMESNGKSITRDGVAVDHSTSLVIFGATGTTGQHSFYQMLHQGTATIPADIIVQADASDWLAANALAQAKAFMEGKDDSTLPPHRRFAGQRASTVIILPTLSPATLGALIVFYEHKTFVEGILWRINSFDQWGVELGKVLATDMHAALHGKTDGLDEISTALLAKLSSIKR